MKLRKRALVYGMDVQQFWPSFTDVMSTIALILFFLMLLAYLQNIIYGNDLAFAQRQLDASKLEIGKAKEELRSIQLEIDKTKAALVLSSQQVEDQKAVIATSNEALEKLKIRLQGIALLRLDILKKVKASVEQELGKRNEKGEEMVSIGDNANIIINESTFFAYNSYKLKPEAKVLLAQLAKAFEKILDDGDVRANIDAVSIDGHTDDTGAAGYNRELSARRATEVVNYMMQVNPKLEQKYGRYFAANGFSEFRPLASGKDENALAKNRRIEISIIIKDSNIQDMIEKYLNGTEELLSGN